MRRNLELRLGPGLLIGTLDVVDQPLIAGLVGIEPLLLPVQDIRQVLQRAFQVRNLDFERLDASVVRHSGYRAGGPPV